MKDKWLLAILGIAKHGSAVQICMLSVVVVLYVALFAFSLLGIFPVLTAP